MQAIGVTSPEQLALAPQMLAIINHMLAAPTAQAAAPPSVSALIQDAGVTGAEAEAKEEQERERLLAVEVSNLNAIGADPTYSAGTQSKHSDRVNPLSRA